MHVSYLAILAVASGVFLLFNFREGSSKVRLFAGVLLILVIGPALYSYDQLGDVFKSDILWSVGGIVGGALLVWLMIDLFSNTSPESTSFNQFFCFGFYKWDDFAQYLLIGLVIAAAGIYSLFQSTSRAIEYRGAYDSIRKCEREKPMSVSNVRTAASTVSKGVMPGSNTVKPHHAKVRQTIAVNKKAHSAH